jgi:2'-5' RNA ligase
VRLFVALTLAAEERERIHQATAPLRRAGLPVRWIPPAALHVTLKFLGHCPPELVLEIEAAIAIAATRTQPFELYLGGFGAFPTFRAPRVLWLGVEATPPLRCLKQDLEWELAPLGFERETRAFQPHLTLGRATATAQAGDFRQLGELLQPLDYQATAPVSVVDLMQSRLTPARAEYERIATLPLG